MTESPAQRAGEARIGVIGWGRMGGPMGRRWLEAGHSVVAFDLSESSIADAERSGAQVAESPRAVAEGCDIVITMLPHGPAVEAAARAERNGILAGLQAGTLWVEMTSSDPEVTAAMAEEATARGVDFVDAPVTGGVPKAVSGELTVMVAGPPKACDRAKVVFDSVAAHVFRVGERPGMGDVAKTVNNLLSAVNLLVAAEGLSLAVDYGIEPERLLEVLNSGTGQSNATSWKIPQYVLTERFDSGFTIGQYDKDLRIAMGVAESREVPMVVSRLAARAWNSLAADMAEADHTEIVRAVLSRVPYRATDLKEYGYE